MGSFTCVTAGGRNLAYQELVGNNSIFFAYDTDTNTVRYVYFNAPYIEDLDSSHFFSLDW